MLDECAGCGYEKTVDGDCWCPAIASDCSAADGEQSDVERSGNPKRSADRLVKDLQYIHRMLERQHTTMGVWINEFRKKIADLNNEHSKPPEEA